MVALSGTHGGTLCDLFKTDQSNYTADNVIRNFFYALMQLQNAVLLWICGNKKLYDRKRKTKLASFTLV